jgi:hypothetical protein
MGLRTPKPTETAQAMDIAFPQSIPQIFSRLRKKSNVSVRDTISSAPMPHTPIYLAWLDGKPDFFRTLLELNQTGRSLVSASLNQGVAPRRAANSLYLFRLWSRSRFFRGSPIT